MMPPVFVSSMISGWYSVQGIHFSINLELLSSPFQVGPTQCRTRTVLENTSPELLRDFYWDDEFRIKWDKMLVYFKTLYACPQTGTMVVHWIRKVLYP